MLKATQIPSLEDNLISCNYKLYIGGDCSLKCNGGKEKIPTGKECIIQLSASNWSGLLCLHQSQWNSSVMPILLLTRHPHPQKSPRSTKIIQETYLSLFSPYFIFFKMFIFYFKQPVALTVTFLHLELQFYTLLFRSHIQLNSVGLTFEEAWIRWCCKAKCLTWKAK